MYAIHRGGRRRSAGSISVWLVDVNCVCFLGVWLAGGSLPAAPAALAAEPAAGTHAGGGDAPFLNAWLLLGPCQGGENMGLETDFIDEVKAMPRAGLTMAGKSWEAWDDRLYCRNYDDYQDLYSYYRIVKKHPVANCAAYAHLYVWSPEPRKAQLRIGANDIFRAYVNGKLVRSSNRPQYAARDAEILDTELNRGWNRLLLKICNAGPVKREAGERDTVKYLEMLPEGQGSELTWGFYARLCDASGQSLSGLVTSLTGPGQPLGIDTWALPVGYREWPYVWLRLSGSNDVNDARASRFQFLAEGGEPPYRWSLTKGQLPAGVTLDDDGTLGGICQQIGVRDFTVMVRDAKDAKAEKTLRIEVKERPNRWFEEARFGSLMHGTETKDPVNQDKRFILETGRRFQRMGFQYVCTKSLRNAEHWVPGLREAGIRRVGLYMSRLGEYQGRPFHNDYFFEQAERYVREFQPAMFWFDEFGFPQVRPRCRGRFEFDALFSMIRTYDSGTLILNNNGDCSTYGRGDVDILEAEGWATDWGRWPDPRKLLGNPKTLVIESWRFPNNTDRDWQKWVRIVFSLVGEGHVANLDGTVAHSAVSGPKDTVPFQEHIAGWMHPDKAVDLSAALVGTQPVRLKNAAWGFAVRKDRDLYLYVLKTPVKTGWPASGRIEVQPESPPGDWSCNGAELMNTGKKIPWTVEDRKVVLKLDGIQPDPVVSVIRLSGKEVGRPIPPTAPAHETRIPIS